MTLDTYTHVFREHRRSEPIDLAEWTAGQNVITEAPGDIIVGMVRTIIQLPEDQAAALAREARRRGVSKAAVVREALDSLLLQEDGDAAVERALGAAGSGASGVRDLAERHDAYLAERQER